NLLPPHDNRLLPDQPQVSRRSLSGTRSAASTEPPAVAPELDILEHAEVEYARRPECRHRENHPGHASLLEAILPEQHQAWRLGSSGRPRGRPGSRAPHEAHGGPQGNGGPGRKLLP